MVGNNEHFERDNALEFSDETIRRFLLGCLSATEQPSFEQRLLTDDALEARVRLAELDLADDYAFERLSTSDRQSFEQRFLSTPDRQQKLQVSKVLRDRFSARPPAGPESSAFAERLRYLFRLDRTTWRFAFGVLILLILIGTAFLVIKEPRIAHRITNKIRPRSSPAPGAPREAGHGSNTSVPEHQTSPSPMPVHDQTAESPVSVSVALTPSVSPWTSEMTAINLPKSDEDLVRLQLAIKPDQSGPYQAELLTIEGSSVFSADLLKPRDSGAIIDCDVPAGLLKTGDYQIKLNRVDGGSKESVASYYFRVQ